MKLMIADDHGLFRLGLKAAIEQKIEDIEVLEAEDTKSALSLLGTEKDIKMALLDINIPGNEGLSFIYSVLQDHPELKVCVISGDEDPCLLYTSPSPRDKRQSRMPSSA